MSHALRSETRREGRGLPARAGSMRPSALRASPRRNRAFGLPAGRRPRLFVASRSASAYLRGCIAIAARVSTHTLSGAGLARRGVPRALPRALTLTHSLLELQVRHAPVQRVRRLARILPHRLGVEGHSLVVLRLTERRVALRVCRGPERGMHHTHCRQWCVQAIRCGVAGSGGALDQLFVPEAGQRWWAGTLRTASLSAFAAEDMSTV